MRHCLIVATVASLSTLSTFSTFSMGVKASERLPILAENSPNRIADEYIVIYKDKTSLDLVRAQVDTIDFANRARKSARAVKQFSQLKGFSGIISQKQLAQLRVDPNVKSIEANQLVSASFAYSTSPVDSWALDRIDQTSLPLDTVYAPEGHGNGVHAYVIDTGIYTEHLDFGGRASWAFTASNITDGNTDGNGHGTHMAGVLGSNTWGVAREVSLHAVKVLDNNGQGTLAGLIEGIDFVTANHQSPAVATIGFHTGFSQTLNDAVASSIAAGVVYAVPAGDDNRIACDYSPGSLSEAISVSSTDRYDVISGSANTGSCVDVFAPGLYVKSAWHSGPTVNNTISHSPISAAMTAGVAAIMRGHDANCTPAQVKQKILNKSKKDQLANVPAGTNNYYVSVMRSDIGGCEGDDPTSDGTLLAMLPFTGNANDVSGNGYHGSINGAQLTSDRFGRANSAYFFNGNDRIQINGLSGYGWGASFTASVWFRRTGNWGNYQGVISNGYYSSGSWEMRMGRESSGQRLVYLVTGPVQGGETSTAYQNQWHHAVLTFDGTRVIGYMDNKVVVNFPRTTPVPTRNNPVFIGHPGTVGGEYFYGVIDDVRLYNRALSAAEVAELYNATIGDSELMAP